MRLRAFLAAAAGVVLIAACGASPASSSTPDAAVPAPTAPPRLVVAISVDQFSADLFAQYRQHYTGGLARLMQGAVFPSAYQSHAATETCPGHATILTGVHPARAGIISNLWFDPALTARPSRAVYCVEDETDPASSSRAPVVSAAHLKVPTLGEYMKRTWPGSRNVAVSAKDRAVMMMGGHDIDAAYWYLRGQFITLRGRTPSPAAMAVNAGLAGTIARGAPAYAAPAWCAPKSRPVTARKYLVGTGRFPLPAGSSDAFRISPRMDAATVDLALRLVDEMKLGHGTAPDLLSVSLSATDYIGHKNGSEGMEMCIQMAELDRAIGTLFARLDARKIDYQVVLTADHGAGDIPERLVQQAVPDAVRRDPALTLGNLAQAITAELGLTVSGPLFHGDNVGGDIYVTHALPAQTRERVAAALTARLRPHPEIAAVFARDDIAREPAPTGNPQDWPLLARVRANFDPARSGDVYVVLRRGVVGLPETSSDVVTHGSPWDYDRRVPLLFWRKGLPGFEQPAPVQTIDIAPTLAATLGLKVPAGSFDGRCLDIDGTENSTCP